MEVIFPPIRERFSRLISYFPSLFLNLIPAFLFRMTGDPAERETLPCHCLFSRFSNPSWAMLPRPIRLFGPRILVLAAISTAFLPACSAGFQIHPVLFYPGRSDCFGAGSCSKPLFQLHFFTKFGQPPFQAHFFRNN